MGLLLFQEPDQAEEDEPTVTTNTTAHNSNAIDPEPMLSRRQYYFHGMPTQGEPSVQSENRFLPENPPQNRGFDLHDFLLHRRSRALNLTTGAPHPNLPTRAPSSTRPTSRRGLGVYTSNSMQERTLDSAQEIGYPGEGAAARRARLRARLDGLLHGEQHYQAPEQGYQAPEQGYQAQEQGYQAQEQGYQAQEQGYQAQGQRYQAPQQQYQAPEQRYEAPEQRYQAQEQGHQGVSYQAQEQGYQAPEQGYQGVSYQAQVEAQSEDNRLRLRDPTRGPGTVHFTMSLLEAAQNRLRSRELAAANGSHTVENHNSFAELLGENRPVENRNLFTGLLGENEIDTAQHNETQYTTEEGHVAAEAMQSHYDVHQDVLYDPACEEPEPTQEETTDGEPTTEDILRAARWNHMMDRLQVLHRASSLHHRLYDLLDSSGAEGLSPEDEASIILEFHPLADDFVRADRAGIDHQA